MEFEDESGKGVNTDGRSSTKHNHEGNFLLKHSKKDIFHCKTMSWENFLLTT